MIQNEAWIKQYREEKGSRESVSGNGSTLKNTTEIRAALPFILENYKISSMVDVPCGDWNWMQHVDLRGVDYIGCDVVPQLIDDNIAAHGDMFRVLDITTEVPPKAHLLLCRDLLFHLPNNEILAALDNIRASGCDYFLSTTFHGVENRNVHTGSMIGWRQINLCAPPFSLPHPIFEVQENYSEACQGRVIALFRGF